MFINAQLRPVLHGFESFVPQRPEFLRQRGRLINMTNNGVSAWADFRDAASLASTPESCWDHHNDDFGDNENKPPTNAYHRYCQDMSRVSEAQNLGHHPRATPCTMYQEEIQGGRRPSTLRVCDEQMVAGLSVFDGQTSSLIGHASQDWGSNTNRHNNIAQTMNSGNTPKNHEYQPLSESCLTSVPSALPVAQPQPQYLRAACSILDESFGIHQTSPNTEYSDFSSSTDTSKDPLSPTTYNLASTQGSSTNSQWWPPTVHDSTDQYQLPYTLSDHDGLPRFHDQARSLETWSNDDLSVGWPTQASVPRYMSPKQFPVNRFHAASSSFGSSQGTSHSFNESIEGDARSDLSHGRGLPATEPSPPREIQRHRHRHMLPDSSSSSRNVPVLRSNDSMSSKSRSMRNRSHDSKSANSAGAKTSHRSSLEKNESVTHKAGLKRLEPKLKDYIENGPSPETSQSIQALHQREAKDEFLVKSKLAGMSYKDIRRQGKFTEAESTLRGRFRTLTKHKNARVRKPEWNDNDVRLLKRATRKLTPNPGCSRGRIPWKQVAEYIASHGGSYHFGNATCRKKWDELQGYDASE